MRRLAVVVLVVAAGCGEEAPKAPAPLPPAPLRVDDAYLTTKVRARMAEGFRLASLRAAYVRADGLYALTHGEFRAQLIRPAGPAPDDPSRPLGAPPPPPLPPGCHDVSWRNASLTDGPASMCFLGPSEPATSLRCTVSQIWQRALADGAPAEALATVTFMPMPGIQPWRFAIEDAPRGVFFSRDFADDCPVVVEAPPS